MEESAGVGGGDVAIQAVVRGCGLGQFCMALQKRWMGIDGDTARNTCLCACVIAR